MKPALALLLLAAAAVGSAAATRLCCYDVGCSGVSSSQYEHWRKRYEGLVSCHRQEETVEAVCICREADEPCDACLEFGALAGHDARPALIESIPLTSTEACYAYARGATCGAGRTLGERTEAWSQVARPRRGSGGGDGGDHRGADGGRRRAPVPYCVPGGRELRNCTGGGALPPGQSGGGGSDEISDARFRRAIMQVMATGPPLLGCACDSTGQCAQQNRNPACCTCVAMPSTCTPPGNSQSTCDGCCDVPTYV